MPSHDGLSSRRPSVQQQHAPASSISKKVVQSSHAQSEAPASDQADEHIERARGVGFTLADIPILPLAGTSAEAARGAIELGQRASASRLPHAERLQQAFGHHDIGDVRAHMGPLARASAEAIDASAFASGSHVVFARPPSLFTAAHEAAHVIQQRAGIRLPGPMDRTGDRYEQHAEAVAKRVAVGQSAEALLDRVPGRPQASFGNQAQKSLAGGAGLMVQRVREGLTGETQELGAGEMAGVKALLEQESKAPAKGKTSAKKSRKKKEPVSIGEKDVQPGSVGQLTDQLIKLAGMRNREYDKKAEAYTGATKNDLKGTPYEKLLGLAIDKALGQYGQMLKAALAENQGKGAGPLAQVANNPVDKSPIGLKLPQQIYDDLPKEEREAEARAAIQYHMQYTSSIKQSIALIRQTYKERTGQEAEEQSVRAAYLEALMAQPDKSELVEELAKQRVRWSPQTRGSTVYLQPEGKVDRVGAWLTYKQLLHEALHTAAHRNFEAYLDTLPEGLRNTFNEGTVDYFANKVWERVAGELQADISSSEIGTVHGITTTVESDQLGKEDVRGLQKLASEYLYGDATKIRQAVEKLGASGEDRLKAAFFYGDVYHFFPRYEPEASEEEEEKQEMEISPQPKKQERPPSPEQPKFSRTKYNPKDEKLF